MSNLTYGQTFAANLVGLVSATFGPVLGTGTALYGITAAIAPTEFYSQVSSTYGSLMVLGHGLAVAAEVGLIIGGIITAPVGGLGLALAGTTLLAVTAVNYTINGILLPIIANEIHEYTHQQPSQSIIIHKYMYPEAIKKNPIVISVIGDTEILSSNSFYAEA